MKTLKDYEARKAASAELIRRGYKKTTNGIYVSPDGRLIHWFNAKTKEKI